MKKRWSVQVEDLKNIRGMLYQEVWEETGYNVEVVNKIYEKEAITYGVPVYVHYYVKRIGGSMKIQDPDELIHKLLGRDR